MSGNITVCLKRKSKFSRISDKFKLPKRLAENIIKKLNDKGGLPGWEKSDSKVKLASREVKIDFLNNKMKLIFDLIESPDGYSIDFSLDQKINIINELKNKYEILFDETLAKIVDVETSILNYESLKYYCKDDINVELDLNNFHDERLTINVSDNANDVKNHVIYYAVQRQG